MSQAEKRLRLVFLCWAWNIGNSRLRKSASAKSRFPCDNPLQWWIFCGSCHHRMCWLSLHDNIATGRTRLRSFPNYNVARLRDSFEWKEITIIQWIPGKHNISDYIRKVNLHMFKILNKIACTGISERNFVLSINTKYNFSCWSSGVIASLKTPKLIFLSKDIWLTDFCRSFIHWYIV